MTATLKDQQTEKNKTESDSYDLDLVRNILFGEQIQQTEKRGMELERLLEISIDSLRDESIKKFDTISHELSTIVNLLTDETKVRETEFKKMRDTFDHITHQFEQANKEMSLKLEQAVAKLKNEKVDRKAISSLLSGMAKQLDTNSD